jgi:hypothetical protein
MANSDQTSAFKCSLEGKEIILLFGYGMHACIWTSILEWHSCELSDISSFSHNFYALAEVVLALKRSVGVIKLSNGTALAMATPILNTDPWRSKGGTENRDGLIKQWRQETGKP